MIAPGGNAGDIGQARYLNGGGAARCAAIAQFAAVVDAPTFDFAVLQQGADMFAIAADGAYAFA